MPVQLTNIDTIQDRLAVSRRAGATSAAENLQARITTGNGNCQTQQEQEQELPLDAWKQASWGEIQKEEEAAIWQEEER